MSFSSDLLLLPVCKEEVPLEQQEWSSSLVQEEPQPLHIKEEQEEQSPVEADGATRPLRACRLSLHSTQPPTRDEQLLSSHGSESDTEDSEDWEETREGQSALNRQNKSSFTRTKACL